MIFKSMFPSYEAARSEPGLRQSEQSPALNQPVKQTAVKSEKGD